MRIVSGNDSIISRKQMYAIIYASFCLTSQFPQRLWTMVDMVLRAKKANICILSTRKSHWNELLLFKLLWFYVIVKYNIRRYCSSSDSALHSFCINCCMKPSYLHTLVCVEWRFVSKPKNWKKRSSRTKECLS